MENGAGCCFMYAETSETGILLSGLMLTSFFVDSIIAFFDVPVGKLFADVVVLPASELTACFVSFLLCWTLYS